MEPTQLTRARASSHQDYLDTLLRPTATQSRRISDIQIRKELEIDGKYHTEQEEAAATKIQRMYRGHRERRQLEGLTLDPSSRWVEVIREWRFRSAIAPQSFITSPPIDGRPRTPSDVAKANWRRAGEIAEHAGAGDTGLSPVKTRTRPRSETQSSMLLDLRYFLEMVDQKHRYGANLQVYHQEWQRSNTDQNFFVWLDHGKGKELDLPMVSRERLDRERVRYLSKEERMSYLVQVDDNGRLRWMKNGELITTSAGEYQDSALGIVPRRMAEGTAGDDVAETLPLDNETDPITNPAGDFPPTYVSATLSSSSDSDSADDSPTTPQPINPKPRKRHLHVSPATLLNSLLRASVKPGTWIYVADTVGRLYIGIKASGAFQHASFLSGARISSAGAIGIEDGRLTYLSPLSGHYRPTTKSFREFVDGLKADHVDLSALKVSKSYAVLLGMEYYGKTKGEVRKILHREKTGEGARSARVDSQGTGEGARNNVNSSLENGEQRRREHRKLGKLLRDLNIRRHGPE